MLRQLTSQLVDVVFPPTCAGCDRRGVWICARCIATVTPLRGTLCERCGAPLVLDWCQCVLLDEHLDQVRSALPYRGWVITAVHNFKYRDETARASSMATWLLPSLKGFGEVDGLVAVPLHARRLRQRGYNQAELLTRELSRLSGTPVLTHLERTRHTPPQVGASADQRRANVEGAFALRAGQAVHPGGRYVLVDDVRTTGATLGACAAALAPAEPSWVGALTFAWTMAPVDDRWHRLNSGESRQTPN